MPEVFLVYLRNFCRGHDFGSALSDWASSPISDSECRADRLILSRAVPVGTVGVRIAGTSKPRSFRICEARAAAEFVVQRMG